MKIREIVNEAYHGFIGRGKEYGSIRHSGVDEAIPSAIIEPRLRNTDTYMQMRYGMALAAAAAADDPAEFDQESVWAENMVMIGYTPEEIEIIQAADKLMGVKGVQVSHKGSQERPDAGTTSPVANTSWRKAKK